MTRARALLITSLLAASLLVSCGDEDDAANPTNTSPPAATQPPAASPTAEPERALIVYEARAVVSTSTGGDDDRYGTSGELGQTEATNVHVIDPETGETTQLTSGTSFDGNPGWSIDRSRIIFSSDRDSGDKWDLYTMNPDGSGVQRLTDTPDVSETSAIYSPDGASIAYTHGAEGEWYVAVVDAGGANARNVAGPLEYAEFPAWSNDSATIYFAAIGEGTQQTDILAAGVATGETRTIVSTPGPDVCPHVMPDGVTLVYASTLGEEGELDVVLHDLRSTDATGASDRRIAADPAHDDYAAPSPDGAQFVFISAREGGGEERDLYIMNTDGSAVRRLAATPNVRENVPDW